MHRWLSVGGESATVGLVVLTTLGCVHSNFVSGHVCAYASLVMSVFILRNFVLIENLGFETEKGPICRVA